LGQAFAWRSLGRSLLANFKACAVLLRLLATKAAASKSISYNNGWPLLPLQHSKNPADAASKASCEQRLRNVGKLADFSAAKNFSFVLRLAALRKQVA
jgi:hypothetical protein